MSPLWRNELTVVLAPGEIWLRHVPRGLRRPALTEVVSCEAADLNDWKNAVAAFSENVSAWQGARATIVLSNHFVRYGVVPPCPELNAAEFVSFARHQLVRLYGPSATNWVLRINPGDAALARMVSGVAPPLLDSIAATVQAAGMRLVSIQPLLMAVFNTNVRAMGKEPSWLALAEPGRVVVALRHGERWSGVWSARAGRAWDADLIALLDRAYFLSDDAEDVRTVWLCASRVQAKVLPSRPWQFRELAPWPVADGARRKHDDAPAAP